MEEKENLENSIENYYNVKIEKEYFRNNELIKKIKEEGFIIKGEIALIDTYCIEIYIPECIEKEKIKAYKDEKTESLRKLEHILRVDEAKEMKALNKEQDNYNTN